MGKFDSRERQLLTREEAKEELKSSAVCFERVAAETSLGLEEQPSTTVLVGSDERKALPTNRLDDEVHGQRTPMIQRFGKSTIIAFVQDSKCKHTKNSYSPIA